MREVGCGIAGHPPAQALIVGARSLGMGTLAGRLWIRPILDAAGALSPRPDDKLRLVGEVSKAYIASFCLGVSNAKKASSPGPEFFELMAELADTQRLIESMYADTMDEQRRRTLAVDFWRSTLKFGVSVRSLRRIWRGLTEPLDGEIGVKNPKQAYDRLADEQKRLNSTTSPWFVLGDTPVVLFKQDANPYRGYGFATEGVEVHMPISSTHVWVATAADNPLAERVIDFADVETANGMNAES